MPVSNLAMMRERVKRILINAPTSVLTDLDTNLRVAQAEMEDRYSFQYMEYNEGFATKRASHKLAIDFLGHHDLHVGGTVIYNPIFIGKAIYRLGGFIGTVAPDNSLYLGSAGDPMWWHATDGTFHPMQWAQDTRQMVLEIGDTFSSDGLDREGPPKFVEERADYFAVWPTPDAGGNATGTDYRYGIQIPMKVREHTLSLDMDTNRHMEHASIVSHIVYAAAALSLAENDDARADQFAGMAEVRLQSAIRRDKRARKPSRGGEIYVNADANANGPRSRSRF